MENQKKPIQKKPRTVAPPHIKRQMKAKLFTDYAAKPKHAPAPVESMGAAQSAWHSWSVAQRYYVLHTWLTYHHDAAHIISDKPWYMLGLHVKRKLRKIYRQESNPI